MLELPRLAKKSSKFQMPISAIRSRVIERPYSSSRTEQNEDRIELTCTRLPGGHQALHIVMNGILTFYRDRQLPSSAAAEEKPPTQPDEKKDDIDEDGFQLVKAKKKGGRGMK